MEQLQANIVDIPTRRIYWGQLQWANGQVHAVTELGPEQPGHPYLSPGFVDAHVHIESSLLVPSEFARLAVVHGTVATVSDPHEIANVCGVAGVNFMIDNGRAVPFKFNFGAPSCVPATTFETAGAEVTVAEVEALLARPEIRYLSEMMNFPGVLDGHPEVMAKIAAAHAADKPVDGHAPGLRGEALQSYLDAGITTDHECFTAEEALDKLQRGMQVIIREGSAAKNFDALIGLLPQWYNRMMFCSDDKHPDSLLQGHINQLCARAVALGNNVYDVLQVACINPVKHYSLPVGQLQPGQPADFVLLCNLTDFEVTATYINGELVASVGKSLIKPAVQAEPINQFANRPIAPQDLAITHNGLPFVPVIVALDGQLITLKKEVEAAALINEAGYLEARPDIDTLKIAVINRYAYAPVAVAFIQNFGLKNGALASSVAHDSHNVVVVGTSDEAMVAAANAVMQNQGGLSAAYLPQGAPPGDAELEVLPLPVAGLMSAADGYAVAEAYTRLDTMAKTQLQSTLASPFMTLSFMALLVIPHLKLSDRGLFDGDKFSLV